MARDPSELVSLMAFRYRGCFSRLDGMRGKQKYPTTHQAERLLVESYCAEFSSAALSAPALCAGAIWNLYKRSFVFHEVLAGFLMQTAENLEPDIVLPTEGLTHLPVPCVYVQAPGIIAEGIDGFYAWSEDGEIPVLRLLFVFDGLDLMLPSYLYIKEAQLSDCLPDAKALTESLIWAAYHGCDRALSLLSGEPNVPGKLGGLFQNLTLRAVQLLLYLVSMDADIEDNSPPQGDTKHTVSVGEKIGERLKAVASQKRSHIRQGHWHKYWVGPKAGERRQVAKWIEPVIVGDGRIKASKIVIGKNKE